ncbi:MAG: AIR synthase-related protein [bacterium]|nr:AIR synthase-related protein [bacterium]
MSKFPLRVLRENVYAFTGVSDPDVMLGAAFGEDAAMVRVGGDILLSHVDPIVGAVEGIGYLAVHVACNDIAARGIPPRWILLLIMVPRLEDAETVGRVMADCRRAADEIDVSIIGGHTGYSSGISRPLAAVTALGVAGGRTPILTAGARIGDVVLVTKGVALEGTAILAQDFAGTAKRLGLGEEEIAGARRFIDMVSVIPEALDLAEQGAHAMHDATRGGLLETLLEIAHLSNVGIEIDASSIPVDPLVARFAGAFGFDPLRMISSGTLAATVPPEQAAAALERVRARHVVCAAIGTVVEGGGVRVVRGGEVDFHDEIRCEEDELARMWARHRPDGSAG